MRLDLDVDAVESAIPVAAQPDVAVNKSRKMLNSVQKGFNLQLNSWSPFRGWALSSYHTHITRTSGDQLFFTTRSLVAPSMVGGGRAGGDGLPNSRSRRRWSPRVTDSPRPRP